MAEDKTCAAKRIISELARDGWKIQKGGLCCLNGTVGTNLYKDGEVIIIQQGFCPDEEFIEQQWPEEYEKYL